MRVCLVLSLWTLFVSYVISASPVISSGHLLWVWLDHRKHDAECGHGYWVYHLCRDSTWITFVALPSLGRCLASMQTLPIKSSIQCLLFPQKLKGITKQVIET